MIRRSVFVYIAAIVLLLCGIVLPEILGASRSDYSSFSNYISELGADGTSTQRLTNTLLFPMVGISLIAILIALWHRLPERAAIRAGLVCLGLGLALAYLGAAIFPCDYGCPIDGSPKQNTHNLLALIQYPMGVIGFALLGLNLKEKPLWRWAFVTAAAAMAFGFVLMLQPEQAGLRGFWQRLGDYMAFMTLIGVVISTQPHLQKS